MSGARALANQKLYHAKILTDAWRLGLAEEQVVAPVLSEAFGLPVRRCLAEAYGWFLVEIAQPAIMPAQPPARCAQLPPPAEGRQTPPEILEFQQLENSAWLKTILNPVELIGELLKERGATSLNLAAVIETNFDPDQAEASHAKLSQLFDRMADSLEEY